MNNIDGYISTINSAIRGEDVRDAIVGALTQINRNDSNAYTLNGHPASHFAKQSDMEQVLPLDYYPTENSMRGVTSGGLYNMFEDVGRVIDRINGEQI